MGQVKKRVLIAPLDWGLGHATRCIPIIYQLLALDVEVIIAAGGRIKSLLQNDFSGQQFVFLNGYNIVYSGTKRGFAFKLMAQFPKILWHIYTENKWIKKVVKEHKIDAIISDNRLGLYHSTVPCIYITHQLKIKTGNRFTEWLAQKIHYFFINKYTGCWIPDNELANDNLAGELSHPKKLPKTPVQYIGPLSRFEKIVVEKKYDLLLLLSGPEPQRTLFETLLLKQIPSFNGTVLLVRGLPQILDEEPLPGNAANKITVVNHLAAAALSKAVQQSNLVISRSGYTTIMDLIKLRQKAILVPTTGQTEQEYLAAYLMEKKIFFSSAQNNFSLYAVLKEIADFPFANVTINQNKYQEVVKGFAEQLL
jgi:uncharacterized protein (TIGR00661 family)